MENNKELYVNIEENTEYGHVFDEEYLNSKIEKATQTWQGIDVDVFLHELRGYD